MFRSYAFRRHNFQILGHILIITVLCQVNDLLHASFGSSDSHAVTIFSGYFIHMYENFNNGGLDGGSAISPDGYFIQTTGA